jgi:hypothetical protein
MAASCTPSVRERSRFAVRRICEEKEAANKKFCFAKYFNFPSYKKKL